MTTRKHPCFHCGDTESSQAYQADPWCCDLHHKQLAELLDMEQKVLTPQLFELVMSKFTTVDSELPLMDRLLGAFKYADGADYISKKFTAGFVSTEDLLGEYKGSGNWRDTDLSPTLAGWPLSQLQATRLEIPDRLLRARGLRRDTSEES